ncbi:ABC transporter ATP-binding protein [Microbacterium sp. BWT-B31]|uniref:ATP-binding cassette domain-containing protein n=1 Tax=Microbacterium sp. BWT-B31 TaxID=3232072 RepID=UPI003528F728
MHTTHEDELREWARGLLPLEAATELLIRTGWAAPGYGWIRREDDGRVWIDFESIPERIGALSGGEQRVLRIAASLGADSPIILGDELAGLDRTTTALVLAAIAHTAGVHTVGRSIEVNTVGLPALVDVPPLYTWPI